MERSYTFQVSFLRQSVRRLGFIFCVLAGVAALAQEPSAKPEPPSAPSEKSANDKPADKTEEKAVLPFQIELLETHVRFAANGDSRKEVHTIVKINDGAGARQFARLGFDYNREFQSVEIPQVKITHANRGTSEILPSAITDAPNPAVEKFPAYQDVRVKSVRILGLQEGDTLEYRVITTTTKHPLAPDFWLEHSFDSSGQVIEERYWLEMPKSREIRLRSSIQPQIEESNSSDVKTYKWEMKYGKGEREKEKEGPSEGGSDLVLTTFGSWDQMSRRLWPSEGLAFTSGIWEDAMERIGAKTQPVPRNILYDFVSGKIATVDLPLGFEKYHFHDPQRILNLGYANAQDKAMLLEILLLQENASNPKFKLRVLIGTTAQAPQEQLPRPSLFDSIFVSFNDGDKTYYLDPSLEVAPFGALPAKYRGKPALLLGCHEEGGRTCWSRVPEDLPYPSMQRVNVDASLAGDGSLHAKIRYAMRGDNELVLREAFHQTAKEGWNEVAGLLALADGFRGHIESVNASDPMETEKPFEVEYEITQPKFVDWAKKPVRIPALLPQIALPDAPGKGAEGKIELGTPLEVETRLTLRLPGGMALQTPPGTIVTRDYATYASKYDGHLNTLTATRHVHFLMRELPVERAADYNAFARAVQLDQAQVITLFPAEQQEKK